MTDIALNLSAGLDAIDLLLVDGGLATDDGLRTAIIISLFTDARARDDDPLPEANADRRGWWGDFDRDDETGSRLWLLGRAKILPVTLARAREYVIDALAWLTEDRIASAVDVVVETIRPDVLAIGVTVERPSGPDRQRYDFVWSASA